MLRLASDENLHGRLVRTLQRQSPRLDLVRIEDAGLRGEDDPTVLEWAASENRILLTHDRQTMIDFAFDRVRQELPMPGLFVVDDEASFRVIVNDILLLNEASEQDEWSDRVLFLPM